jgi:ketosteroid isomerase-like protein
MHRLGDPSDQAALRALADGWDAAIVRKDRAAVAAAMAEDFLHIDSYGNLSNKEQFLAKLLSPALVIDPYEVDDFSIRLFGDTALISGTTQMTGLYQGQAFRTHYRFTDTYVRRQEGWRIVHVQTTELRH